MDDGRELQAAGQSIEQWRSRATQILLMVIAALATPRVVMVLIQWPTSFSLAARATILTLFTALLAITFGPWFGTRTRIWSLTVVSSALGAYQLTRSGLAGDGRLTLITLPMFVLAMAGARAAWIAMGISAAIYSVVAFGMQRGHFTGMLVVVDNPTRLSSWIILGVCAAAHAILLAAVIAALLNVYRRSLQTERDTAEKLREEVVRRTAALEALEIESRRREKLEAALLNAGEEDRRHMAAEVHDGLCQQLTAALLNCAVAERSGPHGQAVALDHIRLARTMLEQSIDEARSLVHRLAPLQMRGQNLPAALNSLAQQTQKSAEIQCTYDEQGDVGHLSPQAGSHLYRIAQEAVRNAVRHSQAKDVTISLCEGQQGIRLCILDDGVGIVPAAPNPRAGMGMQTMRYRAGLIGAELTVENRPEGGLAVVCILPPCRAATPSPDNIVQELALESVC